MTAALAKSLTATSGGTGSGQPRTHADVREARGLGLSGRRLSGGLPDKLHFTRPALARSTPRSAGEQKPQLCGS
ncbi:26S proteasome non-ATPase regulatory subunit 3 [Manis javanica]|nr:26S proteasome non-ATPase regulatory subunit 3 [Manis javanica]